MGFGSKKIGYLKNERFNDVLSDALNSISKSQKIFYVDSSTGSDSYNGTRITAPFATLGAANTACTAGNGDVIFVLPTHAETLTAVTSLAKTYVKIVGLKRGNKRPILTINGAVDLLSLDAANIDISGLEFAIATTDAATAFINVTAAKCRVSDIYCADCSAAANVNVVDVITLASGANNFVLEDSLIRNTTTAVNSFLSIEAAVSNFTMKNVTFFGDVATAGIIDGATATQLFWDRVSVGVVGTTKPAATLDSNPTGLIQNSYFAGTHGTLATNANLGSSIRLMNVLVLEETDGSKQGAQIPAVDAD